MRFVHRRYPFVAFSLAILSACDPSYGYRPVGWAQDTEHWFVHEEPGFRIRVLPVIGLIGQTYIGVEPKVENHSSVLLVFETAELVSKGITYSGKYNGKGELKWRSVVPGKEEWLGFSFDFPKPLFEVLEKRLLIRIGYRLEGQELQYLQVELQR